LKHQAGELEHAADQKKTERVELRQLDLVDEVGDRKHAEVKRPGGVGVESYPN
jgi:hypothetical protein